MTQSKPRPPDPQYSALPASKPVSFSCRARDLAANWNSSVYPLLSPLARLELYYDSRGDLRTVLISIVIMRPNHVGFNAIRQPPMVRVDIHSAAGLKRRRMLISKRRLRSQMRVPAQNVSPKFQSARRRPAKPRPSSGQKNPPVGTELAQVRGVKLAV